MAQSKLEDLTAAAVCLCTTQGGGTGAVARTVPSGRGSQGWTQREETQDTSQSGRQPRRSAGRGTEQLPGPEQLK